MIVCEFHFVCIPFGAGGSVLNKEIFLYIIRRWIYIYMGVCVCVVVHLQHTVLLLCNGIHIALPGSYSRYIHVVGTYTIACKYTMSVDHTIYKS